MLGWFSLIHLIRWKSFHFGKKTGKFQIYWVIVMNNVNIPRLKLLDAKIQRLEIPGKLWDNFRISYKIAFVVGKRPLLGFRVFPSIMKIDCYNTNQISQESKISFRKLLAIQKLWWNFVWAISRITQTTAQMSPWQTWQIKKSFHLSFYWNHWLLERDTVIHDDLEIYK